MNENENTLEHSVTAIAKSGNKLKAVDIRKQDKTIEVLMMKSGEENVLNWQDFAAKCSLSFDSIEEAESEERKPVVVGYDSAGTAFSRVNIPEVEDKELESMVKLQAESRLPLPANQMEIAWRADKEKEGQIAITIAAARRQQVQGFVDKITGFKPTNIFLDCEGIVKAWKEIFSGNAQNAVIINTDSRNTQICLSKKGQLINAVALDMGTEDFTGTNGEEQAENIERFVQDTISIVDLFGIDKSEKLQVFILSDGSDTYNDLVTSLKYEGLNATIAKPNTKKFNTKSSLSENDIFEYRLQIGLALMVIEATEKELNLFKNIYKPFGEEKEKHWLYSPKITGSIAAAILIIFLGVVYAIDVTKPNKIHDIIEQVAPNTDISTLVEQQKVLKSIQQQRIDILQLISQLSTNPTTNETQTTGRGRGQMNVGRIQLDSFDFRMGRVITITGQASDHETLYNFEDQLKKIPGIMNVSWTQSAANRSSSSNPSRATTNTRATASSRTSRTTTNNNRSSMGGISGFGGESVRFSMEFNYGNFTGSQKKSSKK
ncbi:MAG: hypothetical protein JXA96_03195 [Sedimentisphaerales bacterium]|nr:hypothetical protein [Sedimentisphaerales bacterium]